MRGTVAKRLRRQARQETKGLPWSRPGRMIVQTPYGIKFRIQHDPESGRRRYKELKAAYKRRV